MSEIQVVSLTAIKSMQDITPYNRSPQNRRPTVSPRDAPARREAEQRVLYSRSTKVITDVIAATPATATTPAVPEIIETVMTETETYALEPVAPIRSIETLSPDAKARAMERALVYARKSLKSERRKQRDMKRFGLVFVASIFVLVTGYVSIDTWMTNQRVKAGESTQVSGSVTNATSALEGQDEAKPSADSLKNYNVAPSLPRAIYINKINVTAKILPMSVNDKGAIQAPLNIHDAGWYNASVKPDEIGAMFIDGHASGPTREGLFAYLDKLVAGDEIQIEKGDNSRLSYKVVHTEVAPLEGLDMKKMLLPYGNVSRGLNLMTCTGKWLEDQKTYDQRVLVWAEQV